MNSDSASLPLRLWQYQRERFPLHKHGIVIAAFSSSAVSLSFLLRNSSLVPSFSAYLVSFLALLGFFSQLRIADEFKDAESDAKFRPERAVPRGLVSLKELFWLGIMLAIIQLCSVLLYHSALLWLLIVVWLYMGLMGVEFFVPRWLGARPAAYLISHMLIMPIIDLFATACDWLLYDYLPPSDLLWFLLLSFVNGAIIEIGRKTWPLEMERTGVESYSSAWGFKSALVIWFAALLISGGLACVVATSINMLALVAPLVLILLGLGTLIAFKLSYQQRTRDAARLENFSGLWVLSIYLLLGLIPMGITLW